MLRFSANGYELAFALNYNVPFEVIVQKYVYGFIIKGRVMTLLY
jgi:hypothetical protein